MKVKYRIYRLTTAQGTGLGPVPSDILLPLYSGMVPEFDSNEEAEAYMANIEYNEFPVTILKVYKSY